MQQNIDWTQVVAVVAYNVKWLQQSNHILLILLDTYSIEIRQFHIPVWMTYW